MGYQTDFSGQFDLDRELTPTLAKQLRDFNNERHGGNTEPFDGFPGFWCQWTPTEDNKGIEWDGDEKFYNYVEWLEYIIKHFLEPNDYLLNGDVSWVGEESDDLGKIMVKDNTVTVYEGVVTYEPPAEPVLNNHVVWMAIHDALTKLGLEHKGGGDSSGGFEDTYSKGDYEVNIGMRN